MTDWKKLFGIAAIFVSAGFFLRSLQPAYALNGPTTSLGTNPVENINGAIVMNSIGSTTIWTNNSSSDFIVTTILMNTGACYPTVDGSQEGLAQIQNIGSLTSNTIPNVFIEGKAKLKIASGSTLDFNSYNTNWKNCQYYIEGYYVHP